jgi:hypothetical protein
MGIDLKGRSESAHWREYDQCAERLAKQGRKGEPGDPLPDGTSAAVVAEIDADPEAFQRRVREFAYAIAMGEAP